MDRLLDLGEEAGRADPWPDYLALGLTDAHVAELVRLAHDRRKREKESRKRNRRRK